MMQSQPRTLHRLEKIIVVFALAFALALTIGFAQAAGSKRKSQPLPPEDAELLFLRSNVALIQDAINGETVFAKNHGAVLPIASITKLMTALVILDANVDLDAARSG
jgi:D-alanyl-D-alanine endopeptidase (penicillin-binding protein 7)